MAGERIEGRPRQTTTTPTYGGPGVQLKNNQALMGQRSILQDVVSNELLWTDDFSKVQWVKTGSLIMSVSTTIGPNGLVVYKGVTSAINQELRQNFSALAATTYYGYVWLKGDVAQQVTLYITDGVTPSQFVCNVTTEWNPFRVAFTTVGATTLTYTILMPNNTTLYFYGPQVVNKIFGVYVPSVATKGVYTTNVSLERFIMWEQAGMGSIMRETPLTNDAWMIEDV